MTELDRYIRDLIRDGKLVYSRLALNLDGTVEIRRMRLRSEDRPDAPEYVSCILVEVAIDDMESDSGI